MTMETNRSQGNFQPRPEVVPRGYGNSPDDPRDYLGDEYFGSHYEPDDCDEITERDIISVEQSGLLDVADEADALVSGLIGSGKLDERVGPAAKLHVYNVMRKYPRKDDAWRQREIDKIYRMSEIEREYAKQDLLPTLGIEIEIPITSLDRDRKEILNQLEINNVDAILADRNDVPLWEVNPDYSHSPLAQSRVLQELAVMGAIPLEGGKVPADVPLSLHINFGLMEMTDSGMHDLRDKYHRDIAGLNEVLTYAFASSYRIQKRKTTTSYSIKPAKDEYDRLLGYGELALFRLELRAGEFRDYPTFRLLSEAQALAGALIVYIKTEEGEYRKYLNREPTDEETVLALLWQEARKEIYDYLKRYDLRRREVDLNPDKVVEIMKKPGFKEGCREIVTRYAKRVMKVVFPKNQGKAE